MTDATDPSGQVEFISAQDDAAVRLECFRLASALQPNDHVSAVLTGAKALYDWVMDWETVEEAVETEMPLTGEDQCTRKH